MTLSLLAAVAATVVAAIVKGGRGLDGEEGEGLVHGHYPGRHLDTDTGEVHPSGLNAGVLHG
jgi:hypothetical protein